MNQSFGSMLTILIFVIDPFANIPLVVSLLGEATARRRLRIIARECAIAALILMIFLFFGPRLLELFALSDASVDISGGVVLLLIAIRMIFKEPGGVFGDVADGEPFIVPLAIPLIAGPAAIGTVLLLGSRGAGAAHLLKLSAAILTAVALTFFVLAFAERIARRLGSHVLAAIERLMGIVLAALAVEMLLRGITAYVRQLSR